MNNSFSLSDLLHDVEGWLPMPDAQFLSQHAAKSVHDVVEIGSYRGRSTISLAHGLQKSDNAENLVYAIESHQSFVGIHGGEFGPDDREAFYKNVVGSGLAQRIALINLPSENAARAWDKQIGLLFIDGDHRYEAVALDAKLWCPALVRGGLVIFDDARHSDDGPSRVIDELLKSGKFQSAEGTDKLRALQKC